MSTSPIVSRHQLEDRIVAWLATSPVLSVEWLAALMCVWTAAALSAAPSGAIAAGSLLAPDRWAAVAGAIAVWSLAAIALGRRGGLWRAAARALALIAQTGLFAGLAWEAVHGLPQTPLIAAGALALWAVGALVSLLKLIVRIGRGLPVDRTSRDCTTD